MAKIYSFVEAEGRSLVPPAVGSPAEAFVYLTEIEGRHYVSVKKELPEQPKEIELEGPIDFKAAKNRELAEILRQRSGPRRRNALDRAAAYPAIGDQLDALMREFARRRDAGEKLAPELDAVLNKVLDVKKRFPKEDLGLGDEEAGAEKKARSSKAAARQDT